MGEIEAYVYIPDYAEIFCDQNKLNNSRFAGIHNCCKMICVTGVYGCGIIGT